MRLQLTGILTVIAMAIGVSADAQTSSAPPTVSAPLPTGVISDPMEITSELQVASTNDKNATLFLIAASMLYSDYEDFKAAKFIRITIPAPVKQWAEKSVVDRAKLLPDSIRKYQAIVGPRPMYDVLGIKADGAKLEILTLSPSLDVMKTLASIGATSAPAGLLDWNEFSSVMPEEFMQTKVDIAVSQLKLSGLSRSVADLQFTSEGSIGFSSPSAYRMIQFFEYLRDTKKVVGRATILGTSAKLHLRWKSVDAAGVDAVKKSRDLCAFAKERGIRCVDWSYNVNLSNH
tara:strand:+ start:339 stop:1205 length:867 start_codon:yes stop_codon:yes gene_type:complete